MLNLTALHRSMKTGRGRLRAAGILLTLRTVVIPAKAGIRNSLKLPDSGLRGNDGERTRLPYFCKGCVR